MGVKAARRDVSRRGRQLHHAGPSADEIEKRYRNWLRKHDGKDSEQTIRQYTSRARDFIEAVPTFLNPSKKEIKDWYEWIQVGVSPATVNAKITAARNFYKFLVAEDLIDRDPTKGLQRKRIPRRVPIYVREEEVEAVIREVGTGRDLSVLQDRAIVEILFGSGLRRTELATLRLSGIDSRTTLRIVGKGDKERVVPLTQLGYEALRDVILKRHGDKKTKDMIIDEGVDHALFDLIERKPDEFIFYSSEGRPWATTKDPGRFVYDRIKSLGRAAGVDKSPHRYRAGMITELLDRGANFVAVQQAVGHKDPKTTQVYIGGLTRQVKELSQMIRRAE